MKPDSLIIWPPASVFVAALLMLNTLCAYTISAATVPEAALKFTVEGDGQHFMNDPKLGQLSPKSRFQFKVSVDGAAWRIETSSLTKTNSRLRYVDECDGTQVISRVVTLDERGGEKESAETVEKGVKLIGGNSWAGGVWMAFCSRYYFETNRNEMTPIWSRGSQIDALSYKMKNSVQRMDATTRLPREVVAENPGYRWAVFRDRPPERIEYGGALKDGFVEFKFELDETESVKGVKLPKTFAATRFALKSLGTTPSDIQPISKTTFTVKKISLLQPKR